MTDLAVLILADHDDQRRSARRQALSGDDLIIHEAALGSEALELASRHRPDAVALDLDLPGRDGLEVYSALKADTKFSAPVILSLPATASAARRNAALSQSADAYQMEPAEPAVFAATVRSMIRLGRAERERSSLAARLRAAQAEIEQFAAQVCHDVEEPLRAVTTFVQLVEERQADGLNEAERGYLEHVLSASARMRGLLRAFLTYAQAGHSRRAHFGRLDLRSAVAAAVQALRKRVQESQATIVVEGPWPAVWGDFGQLQQVFEQLIRNAIDYHPRGSVPTIHIGATRLEDEDWTVVIRDNGSGIAPDFQSAVFLPFKRLHGRDIPGAGMGLAITRKIVEAHGGKIWVESQPGSGASFRFTIRALETGAQASVQSVR